MFMTELRQLVNQLVNELLKRDINLIETAK